MIYYRLKHRDTLHFCANCQHVKRMLARDESRYVVMESKRSGYELCDECKSKRRREVCET